MFVSDRIANAVAPAAVVVGVISHVYNDVYNGVVLQAVIGTAPAFGAMLTVYSLRIVRVQVRHLPHFGSISRTACARTPRRRRRGSRRSG